jgi:L-lactate dehydrogenase (cytochrome)
LGGAQQRLQLINHSHLITGLFKTVSQEERMTRIISFGEVSKHNRADSCWVILYGKVYDVTAFLPAHPGGQSAILRLGGKEATEEYDPIHPPGTLEENLPAEACLGRIDESTLQRQSPQSSKEKVDAFVNPATIPYQPNHVSQCLNLKDIEYLATTKLSSRAWSYYFSAGDDLISKSLNNLVYQRILLRPRILIDITKCNLTTKLLGVPVKIPIVVSPAAQARLAHPDGEAGIARACAKMGAIQIVSHNASMTVEQILEAAPEISGLLGAQIYVQTDREKSKKWLQRMKGLYEQGKVKFIVLTVDAPVAGKREHDERRNFADESPSLDVGDDSPSTRAMNATGGVGKALFAGTAMDLTWKETLQWMSDLVPGIPIVIKGIQVHEDAFIASTFPQVAGIILSNHGGRALDTAPPSIHTLLEIRRYCPDVLGRIEVCVDGGIMRGTDVVKALCLGAKAVGIGRPPLYALAAGGADGVERVLRILKDEMKTCVRLLGCENLAELGMRNVSIKYPKNQSNNFRLTPERWRTRYSMTAPAYQSYEYIQICYKLLAHK